VKDRNVDGPMHVMFMLKLISGPGRSDASVHALTFVELVSPDVKVGCTRCCCDVSALVIYTWVD
jgi:hypothetical protein